MIFKKMQKILITLKILLIIILLPTSLTASNPDFDLWLVNFKEKAVKSGVSKKVVESVMSEAKYLPKVIGYDRYQPEFYEDTFTYIKKRANSKKVKKGLNLYKKEKKNNRSNRKRVFCRKRIASCANGNRDKFWKILR